MKFFYVLLVMAQELCFYFRKAVFIEPVLL